MGLALFGPEAALYPSAGFALVGAVLANPLARKYMAEGDGHYEDQRLFQRMLDELAAEGGGEAWILPPNGPGGSYNIADGIVIPSRVTVRGVGSSVVLRAGDGLDGTFVSFAAGTVAAGIENLLLDGNYAGQASGTLVSVDGSTEDILIDCRMRNWKTTPLVVTGASVRLRIGRGPHFDARVLGGTGTGRQLGDGAITVGSRRVRSDTANFTGADLHRLLSIGHAGPAGFALTSRITNVVSAIQVDIETAASVSVTDEFVMVGDDCQSVQATIDAAYAVGGGTAYLARGRWHLGEFHHDEDGAGNAYSVRLKSGVTLKGDGPTASVIVMNSQSNCILSSSLPDGRPSGLGVEDLGAEGAEWATTFTGATQPRSRGNQFKILNSDYVSIRNVICWNGTYSFQFGGCADVRVTDCVAIQPLGADDAVPANTGRGFSVFNLPGLPNPIVGSARHLFENCTVRDGTGSGFYVDGQAGSEPYGIKFSNCVAEGNGVATLPQHGFHAQFARVGLSNCEVRGSGQEGYEFTDVTAGSAVGCVADACGYAGTFAGFALFGASSVRLLGCHARNGFGNGFTIASSATPADSQRNVVSGCVATNNSLFGFATAALNASGGASTNGINTYDGCNGSGNTSGFFQPRAVATYFDLAMNMGPYASQAGLYINSGGFLEFKDPVGLTVNAIVPIFSAAYAADGALAPLAPRAVARLSKAGFSGAYTLADPSTLLEGSLFTIVATTAFAHVVSNAAGSGFNAGGAATARAFFAGAIGDTLELVASGGRWYVVSARNVTFGP